MSVRSRTRARTSIIILLWLLIGVFAAFQRGYLSGDPNCSRLSSTAVTVVAGPLNYLGLNPKISCSTPQPSE